MFLLFVLLFAPRVRGSQRENFTIGVGTPFLRLSVLFVRFEGLFLKAKKK